MKRVILCLLMAGVSAVCQAATQSYPVNVSRTDEASQFHIHTSVLNTPRLEWPMVEELVAGTETPYTTPTNSGWGAYLRYGRSDSDPLMATIQGFVSGSTSVVVATTNDFPVSVSGWYAAVVLTNSSQTVSIRGNITVRRSPEVSAPGVLSKTYAVNLSEYNPFTGSGENWPFVLKGSIGELVTNAVTNAVGSINAKADSNIVWATFGTTDRVEAVAGIANAATTSVGVLQSETATWATVTSKLDSNTAYSAFVLAADLGGLTTDTTARAWIAVVSNIAVTASNQAATAASDFSGISNAIRNMTYGPITNDVILGAGATRLLGKESRNLTFQGVNEGGTNKTADLTYFPYGEVDYLYWDGAYGAEQLVMSNGNIQAARLTNDLDLVYQRTGVIGSVVSSVSKTGAVIGAVELNGTGITQTNTKFNFDGYLTTSNAAKTYYTAANTNGYVTSAAGWSSMAATNNVDFGQYSISNISSVIDDGGGHSINLSDGKFVGDWSNDTNFVHVSDYDTALSTTGYANRVTFNTWTTQQGVVNSRVSTGTVYQENFQSTLNSYAVTSVDANVFVGLTSRLAFVDNVITGEAVTLGVRNSLGYYAAPSLGIKMRTSRGNSTNEFLLYAHYNTNLVWSPGGSYGLSERTIWDSGNLSTSVFRSVAAEALFNTNVLVVFHGAPTGSTQVIDSKTKFSIRIPTNRPATNLYFGGTSIGGSGTNWLTIPVIGFVPTDTP